MVIYKVSYVRKDDELSIVTKPEFTTYNSAQSFANELHRLQHVKATYVRSIYRYTNDEWEN